MFIRTKDGISSVEPFTTSKGKTLYEVSGCENLISKDSLDEITIKQADTIEELCDEFIVIDISGKHYHTYDLESAKQYVSIIYIFGAIWTSKGLIYVAKMNDKGELVLI